MSAISICNAAGKAPPTKKVSLLGKLVSKTWEFGKEDIGELIFVLQSAVCRPSGISAMFASRACPKSIMIGTALKKSTMKQLVQHMGEMEQPWGDIMPKELILIWQQSIHRPTFALLQLRGHACQPSNAVPI
ncbi:mismatch repair endonuclease PMS2-like [Glossina fuscipes fuscipes]